MDEGPSRLLGGLFRDNANIPVAAALRPGHFRTAADRAVFAAIAAVFAGGPVDLAAVYLHLRDGGQLDAAGGAARLAGLWDAAAVTARLRGTGGGPSVLVLSACEDVAAVRRALWAGAGGYALKRSAADELVRAVRAVRAVAAGGTYLDPAVAHAMAAARAADELSEREVQALRLIARGYSNKEIAAQMRVSVKTVETYKARGLGKLGLGSRVEVMRYAVRRGWLTDDGPAGELLVGGRYETAG
jgi:DNA-binding NarL/FixJ family response regulator